MPLFRAYPQRFLNAKSGGLHGLTTVVLLDGSDSGGEAARLQVPRPRPILTMRCRRRVSPANDRFRGIRLSRHVLLFNASLLNGSRLNGLLALASELDCV